ncbi:MAG: hypothetical protein ACYDG2_06810 [Ruminiclostridium sp.]
MRARLLPIYFKGKRNDEFNSQVETLKELLAEEAEFLDPVELGSQLPEADAIVFPVLIGEAYKQVDEIKKIDGAIIALTSEFGTVAMWDWEIITFLKAEGLNVFAPYNLELTKVICRAFGVKKELKQTKFLVFQDKPGEAGMQPEIFKRFYWWEDTCTELMEKKFGIKIIKKSFKKLAEAAKSISDTEAMKVVDSLEVNSEGVSQRAMSSAAKMYLAIKQVIFEEGNVGGVGINCLNESEYSDTTPCLAYNMLFQQDGILWVCEGDTMSLMTKYIIYKATKAPIIMSNLYPFLMGMAALKHEKIEKFPEIDEPDNCILVAHCGYMGLAPECFSCKWTLRPRALQIVDENALAVDARLPVGKVTLAKLHSSFDRLQMIEGNLEDYVQYPGSDCRNGAIIRVKNGRRLMNLLYSHHSCIIVGHKSAELEIVAKVFELKIEGD